MEMKPIKSDVGMSWEYLNINEICRPRQWKTLSMDKLLPEGFPVYGANGKIGFYSGYTHELPTLAITCRGATCGSIHITEPQSYINGNAMALDNISDKIDIKFLYYYFILRGFKDVISGSAQPQITGEGLSSVQIPLPPLATQKRIAEILDAADALRRKDQELLKKYDELAQAIFIDMFGDPVKNEKGWEVKSIGSIAKVGSGSTPSRQIPSYFEGKIPWVKTTEVNGEIIFSTEESITEDALKNSSCKMYPKNSVIIAMYGQGKTRGQVAILGIEATTNQACGVILPCLELNPKFLFNYLKLSYSELRNLGRGGNQENLNKGMIEDFLVMIPPNKLQLEFNRKIDNLIIQKSILKKDQSEPLFNSLIQKAFKGELVG